MKRAITLVFILAFALMGATLADYGQAPEGNTSSTANFERRFGEARSLVVIAPDSASVQVLFQSNSATNDTILVEAGDVLNFSPNDGIFYFKVIRTSATKCWNIWYK